MPVKFKKIVGRVLHLQSTAQTTKVSPCNDLPFLIIKSNLVDSKLLKYNDTPLLTHPSSIGTCVYFHLVTEGHYYYYY